MTKLTQALFLANVADSSGEQRWRNEVAQKIAHNATAQELEYAELQAKFFAQPEVLNLLKAAKTAADTLEYVEGYARAEFNTLGNLRDAIEEFFPLGRP